VNAGRTASATGSRRNSQNQLATESTIKTSVKLTVEIFFWNCVDILLNIALLTLCPQLIMIIIPKSQHATKCTV